MTSALLPDVGSMFLLPLRVAGITAERVAQRVLCPALRVLAEPATAP
jgi:hypothetical protein